MGYGPAIFSGLLSGLSGLPRGMEQATQEDLARQRLGLEQQRLAEQQRQFDESRITDLSSITPALQAAGLNLNLGQGGKIQTSLVPAVLKAAELKAERERRKALTGQLSEALTPGMHTPTPGTTFESAPAPLSPVKTAPMSAIATPEDPMAQLRRVLPILTEYDPAAATKALMDLVVPEKPQLVSGDIQGTLTRSGEYKPLQGTQPAPFTPPPNYQSSYSVDKTGRVTTQWKPIEARDDFDRAAYQVTEGRVSRYEDLTPPQRTLADQYVKRFRGDIAARQGEGAATGRYTAEQGQFVGPEAVQYVHPVTGQAPPTTMLMSELTRQGYVKASPKDREDLASLQQSAAIVNSISQMADKLITAQDPVAAAQQGAVLHAGALTKTNPLAATYLDSQQAFLGILSRTMGGERGVLTDRDIARIGRSLPGFFDTQAIKEGKISLLNTLLQTAQEAKRATMTGQPLGADYQVRIQNLIAQMEKANAASSLPGLLGGRSSTAPEQGRRAPIAAPSGGMPERSSPVPPLSSAPQAETLSRQDPRYQKARSLGMTDDQIQQKYGIVLVP
jgi:hypothetical protein